MDRQPSNTYSSQTSVANTGSIFTTFCSILNVVIYLAIASCLVSPSSGASLPACNHRDHSFLSQKLQDHEHGNSNSMPHHSFFSTPNGAIFIHSDLKATGDHVGGSISGTRGSAGMCHPVPSMYVNEASLCAWHHRINLDIDRFPTTLTEAHRDLTASGCPDCYLAEGHSLSGSSATCEAVHYNMPVMRRTDACDAEGYYVYEESWQRLIVGYTCASPTNM